MPIVLNVRRGKDFPEVSSSGAAKGPVRTPLEWFISSLHAVRQIIGSPAQAFVISDGTETDLAPLLRQKNVTFVKSESPMVDLLILAKAKLLIGSGGSSFSAWGSFLGQMPTITYPGQSLQWFKLKDDNEQYVGEFDNERVSEPFKNQLRKNFK